METRLDEIGPGIYRISTFVPEVAPPAGFTFNQFLIAGEEPLLFHTGHRRFFPAVSEAVKRVMPLDNLRWISFGHFEADECGALNDWLAASPRAQPAHGLIGCLVSLEDFSARPPRTLSDGEVVDLGGRRVRYIDTPHVPHGWDAGLIFEETTATLFCGDLFTHVGAVAPITREDIVSPAIDAEEAFQSTSLGPAIAPTIRSLAALEPRTLALMHGASFEGDIPSAFRELAAYYDRRTREALDAR